MWLGFPKRHETLDIGSLNAPNSFGLHDLHGNVWEWMEDCWHNNYEGAPTDGSAWVSACGESTRNEGGDARVARGGSWFDYPKSLRSAARHRAAARERGVGLGFRVARTLSTP